MKYILGIILSLFLATSAFALDVLPACETYPPLVEYFKEKQKEDPALQVEFVTYTNETAQAILTRMEKVMGPAPFAREGISIVYATNSANSLTMIAVYGSDGCYVGGATVPTVVAEVFLTDA